MKYLWLALMLNCLASIFSDSRHFIQYKPFKTLLNHPSKLLRFCHWSSNEQSGAFNICILLLLCHMNQLNFIHFKISIKVSQFLRSYLDCVHSFHRDRHSISSVSTLQTARRKYSKWKNNCRQKMIIRRTTQFWNFEPPPRIFHTFFL